MALLPAFDPSRNNTYSIGFDRMFDSLTSSTGYEERQHTYPPYNIIKVSDTEYIIELAVAGFAKNDIEIRMIADKLSINSIDLKTSEVPQQEYLHKGISARHFKRGFTLSEDMIVKDASMEDGILTIQMERIVPEDKKPRTIKIK
jgi:molecular chaperone IbpA